MADEQQAAGQPPEAAAPQQQSVPEAAPEEGAGKPARETLWLKLQRFLREAQRVLKVTKKPTKEEFITIVKVSGLGLALIGLLGFALTMLQQLVISNG